MGYSSCFDDTPPSYLLIPTRTQHRARGQLPARRGNGFEEAPAAFLSGFLGGGAAAPRARVPAFGLGKLAPGSGSNNRRMIENNAGMAVSAQIQRNDSPSAIDAATLSMRLCANVCGSRAYRRQRRGSAPAHEPRRRSRARTRAIYESGLSCDRAEGSCCVLTIALDCRLAPRFV